MNALVAKVLRFGCFHFFLWVRAECKQWNLIYWCLHLHQLLKFLISAEKKYLLLIADFFHVTVSTKQVIKEELYDELVSTGILPAESPLEVSEGNLAVGEASALSLPIES